MAADVDIVRLTGTTPTETDVTSASSRLSTSDSPTPGTSNPIPIPTSESNRSFWGSFQLKANTAPTGTIDNIRFYSDGTNSYGTGVTMEAQDATSYVQATGTVGTDGTDLTTANHAGLTAAPVNPFTWTSASPKTLTGSTTTTGRFGNIMVMQLIVASTASPGTSVAETFTFVYDET